MNLMNNAIKFTKKGGLVKLEVEEFIHKNLIHINVIDIGVGMSLDL